MGEVVNRNPHYGDVEEQKDGWVIYENEETLQAERSAITIVAEKWKAQAVKLPRRYSADFALLRGQQVKAWAEFKQRKNKMGKYPTYTVSLFKYMNMVNLSKETGVPSFFIVQWEDCTGYVQVPTRIGLVFSGRTDRGDWEDKEPMVEIPLSSFAIMGNSND